MVSCIMFADRAFAFVEQSVRYFLRQDLMEKELLIIAEEPGIEERTVRADAIHFLHSRPSASRQEQLRGAVESCRGRYIALWDCGDWIGANRLTSQLQQLREASAAACVARELTCYCPLAARAWISDETIPSQLCQKTLLFDRLFPGLGPHATAFACGGSGVSDATMTSMRAPWYVSISHKAIPSSQAPGKPIPVGDIAHTIWPDREFYAELRLRARPTPRRIVRAREKLIEVQGTEALPKRPAIGTAPGRVSCIMATHDRRRFVPQAIQCFMEQDYLHRELIILDDGSEPIEDLVPRDLRVHYLRLNSRRSTGKKRNLGCELATGDFLMCWDDDDWSGPDRISRQVAPLLTRRFDATVLPPSYLLDLVQNSFWQHDAMGARGLFLHGAAWGTLAWARKWWEKGVRFPDFSLAEDVSFRESLLRQGAKICRLPNEGAYIYVRHGNNTWQFPFERAAAEGWRVISPPSFLPESALRFYGFPLKEPCPIPASLSLPERDFATLT